MRAIRIALAGVALAAAGCFPDKAFDCGGDDTRCNAAAGERCITSELGWRCASPDEGCAGHFRFGGSAGSLAGQCSTGSLPDGGPTGCVHDGDPCDTGDACMLNGRCVGKQCVGQPMTCPAQVCSFGVQTSSACVKGQCVATNVECDPYICAGDHCASGCNAIQDCAGGSYCAMNKCLSCGDALTSLDFVPHFGTPFPVGGVNQPMTAEDSPFFAADGTTLYFASDRKGPGAIGGFDVYSARRASNDPTTAFTTVTNLGPPFNSAQDDFDPFTLDSVNFYLASDRLDPGMRIDILGTRFNQMGAFDPPDLAPNIGFGGNKPTHDGHPVLSPSGMHMYLQSDRYSPAAGDPLVAIYAADRANMIDGWTTPMLLGGLPPGLAWGSPSVGRASNAMYMVNLSLPSHPEAAFVHLDGAGTPTGNASLLQGIDLAGGSKLSITPDGCGLVFSSHANDGGDIYWAVRDGFRSCNGAVCGTMDDGCCPSSCGGLDDDDCPYPRAIVLNEYYSMTDQHHTYLRVGEIPPPGYMATQKNSFRVFEKAPTPAAQPLYRCTSMSMCDGKSYTWLGTTQRQGSDWKCDPTPVGFVYPTQVRKTVPVWSAISETQNLCDQRIVLDQNSCMGLGGSYQCSRLGFGLLP